MVRYKDLHLWIVNGSRVRASNVKCGLITYKGKRIIGCGKSGETYGYIYKTPEGLTSTVYLCKECSKKVGRKTKSRR